MTCCARHTLCCGRTHLVYNYEVVANVLPFHVRVRIIATLIEGTSIRGTARQTHTNKDAVMSLGLKVGLGCMRLHNQLVTGARIKRIEVDEVWTYVGAHAKRKLPKHPAYFGDVYTFFAFDPETKLVPSYFTGKRTLTSAMHFMKDLRSRVLGKPQMSVDGWPHWIDAVRRTFGYNGVHLGCVVKE